LNVLYSILIKRVLINFDFDEPVAEQLRDRCKHLVISPQGFLSKVPFAALFEKQGEGRGEFLIQQKTVCVIPSVRTLHRCFQRQAQFEKRWEDLAPPFVAGNPKPMGAGKPDIPGAAAEALKVASMLEGAQLFSGERMTKAAVLQGLGRSQLVLLSTHSIKDTSQYPQGALVLRRQLDDSPSCSIQFPTSNNVRIPMEETLIPADIAAIPAEIPACLVVLSACESGLGKIIKTEGVLGLGRVILQKGAATVVLTLWKVNDSATTDLVTGECTFWHISFCSIGVIGNSPQTRSVVRITLIGLVLKYE
jgi:CHAT domain-containing protein